MTKDMQEVFNTKKLDYGNRAILEKFIIGYQRIKKLERLISDNQSYTDFTIQPSIKIMTEKINENYERLENLQYMDLRLVEQEKTAISNILYWT